MPAAHVIGALEGRFNVDILGYLYKVGAQGATGSKIAEAVRSNNTLYEELERLRDAGWLTKSSGLSVSWSFNPDADHVYLAFVAAVKAVQAQGRERELAPWEGKRLENPDKVRGKLFWYLLGTAKTNEQLLATHFGNRISIKSAIRSLVTLGAVQRVPGSNNQSSMLYSVPPEIAVRMLRFVQPQLLEQLSMAVHGARLLDQEMLHALEKRGLFHEGSITCQGELILAASTEIALMDPPRAASLTESEVGQQLALLLSMTPAVAAIFGLPTKPVAVATLSTRYATNYNAVYQTLRRAEELGIVLGEAGSAVFTLQIPEIPKLLEAAFRFASVAIKISQAHSAHPMHGRINNQSGLA